MKRLLKRPFALAWRLTAWLRRPFVRELSHACREAVSPDMAAQTRQLRHLHSQVQQQNQALTELSLALDSVVRELARLHAQLDALHSAPALAGRERAEAG